MREIPVTEIAGTVLAKMRSGGVFLNTTDGQKPNTMVIGWGGVNAFYSTYCFTAPVKWSRYTYKILQKNGAFTVSVPLHDMKEQLAFAGSKSGRDVDKFTGHGLTAAPAQAVNAPIIRECELHIECEPLSVVQQQPEQIKKDVLDRCYPDGDLHALFIGKIVKCYYTD